MLMAFCQYFKKIFKDFFCFVFILLFYDEVWFFCVYVITNFPPLFLQEVTTIFLVIPLYILNHERIWTVWRQMHSYLHLIFYLAMQEVLCQVHMCICVCLQVNHFDVTGLSVKVSQGLPCKCHHIPRSSGKPL